eukprot:TRINITY_DN22277_c0_g1_i1.p1 TRINITY_DN22277_c0_g1~~TRINITY_DN22277_c0_g1_i1.p1  ORF type:complete len:172 (-),score=18.86 TRINITY_DN22277_c0_g1_i1:182-667(-)
MSAREAHRCVAFFLLTLAVAFSCRCRRMAAQQPAALDSLGRRNSQIVRRENEKAIRQASAVDVVSSIGFKAKRSGDEILKASLVAQSEELVSYLRSLAGRDCVSDIAVSLTGPPSELSHLREGQSVQGLLRPEADSSWWYHVQKSRQTRFLQARPGCYRSP